MFLQFDASLTSLLAFMLIMWTIQKSATMEIKTHILIEEQLNSLYCNFEVDVKMGKL